jgi:DNA-binding CsgD family transcriptional regulator
MSGQSSNVAELIAQIHEAAFLPQTWSRVLFQMLDAMGGTQAILGLHDQAPRALRMIVPCVEPDGRRSHCEHFRPGDIFWQRMTGKPVGEIVLLERLEALGEHALTELDSGSRRPVGNDAAAVAVNLLIVNGLPALCGMRRGTHEEVFGSQALELFEAAVPHLVRAAQTNQRVWNLDLQEGLAQAGIGSAPRAVIVTAADGHVLLASDIAAQLLKQPDGLLVDAGSLSAGDPLAADALRRRLADCATTPGHAASGSLQVGRCARPPLQVLVVPFPDLGRSLSAWWHGGRCPAAIVLVTDPDRERESRARRLRDSFGLTPAEAELALEIGAGGGRAAAAARLGITPGTARIHLQRVFEKTGVHRQAELVRLLAELVLAG